MLYSLFQLLLLVTYTTVSTVVGSAVCVVSAVVCGNVFFFAVSMH